MCVFDQQLRLDKNYNDALVYIGSAKASQQQLNEEQLGWNE